MLDYNSFIELLLQNKMYVFVMLLSLIQISPIKINPWADILSFIGKHLNNELASKLSVVSEKQSLIESKLNSIEYKSEERYASNNRARVLAFNTEILRGEKHTREEYNDIFLAIDEYELFCKKNEKYKNERAKLAIKNICKSYEKRCDNNDFL